MHSLSFALAAILLLTAACTARPSDTATVKSVSQKEIILEADDNLMFLRDLPPGTNWRKAVKRGDHVTLVYDESGKHYRSIQFKNGGSILLE